MNLDPLLFFWIHVFSLCRNLTLLFFLFFFGESKFLYIKKCIYIHLAKVIYPLQLKQSNHVCPYHPIHLKNVTKIWQNCAGRTVQTNLHSSVRPGRIWLPEQQPETASSGCQNRPKFRPVLAARTGQFWQPEPPSSGSQNSSQSCCSGQNCAVKDGSTVQAKPSSYGRKSPIQNSCISRAYISAQSPGKSVKMLPRLYKEQPKKYLQCGYKQSSSY